MMAATVISVGVSRLAAELLAHEPFDYVVGDSLVGKNGGIGWGGGWTGSGGASVQVTSTPVSYALGTAIYGGGGSLRVSGGSTVAAAVREIASGAFQSGGDDLYVSLVFRVAGGAGPVMPNRFASWSVWGDAFSSVVDNSAVLNLSGKVGARVNNQTAFVDRGMNYDETYFLVLRFGGWDEQANAYRTTQTWLNPGFYDGTSTAVGVTAAITQTAGGSTGFRGLTLRTHGLSSDSYYFDDIRIGTTWHDVVPVGASAPSPLAARLDGLSNHLTDPVVADSLALASTLAAGQVLSRLHTPADWSDPNKRVVDTSAKYNAALSNTGGNTTLSLQYAQAVSDADGAAILVEELPLIAAAIRLQPTNAALKTYLQAQLNEIVTWNPFQRSGWTIGTGWQAPPPEGNGVWLATGATLQALAMTLDVLPADVLPAALQTSVRLRMREEVALVYSDWNAGIPWYVRGAGKPASNQWIVPISGMVSAACVLGDVPAAHYDYGVARLQQSMDIAGTDGSLSEGYSYGLSWTSLSLMMANHYMTWFKADARFAEGFVPRFPEWAAAGLMPGDGFVNSFDFYGGQHGNHLALHRDYTQLAAFAPGSPLTWIMENVYEEPFAGFYALLVRGDQLVSADPPEPARHGLFLRSRLLAWRNNWEKTGSALWIRGGDTFDFHTHHDRGHVSFTAEGTPVLIEAGTPGYALANKVADYDSAFGHNVLRINGDAYPARTEAGLSASVISNGGGGALVDLAGIYPALQSYTRDVAWTPTMVELIDDLVAVGSSTVAAEMTLHLATAPFDGTAIEQISDREYLIIIPSGVIQWGSAPSPDDFQSRSLRIRVIGSQPITVTNGARPDHTLRFRKPANPHGTLEISTTAPVSSLRLTTRVATSP